MKVHVDVIIAGHRESSKTSTKTGTIKAEMDSEAMRRVLKDFQFNLDQVAEEVSREDFGLKLRP